MQETPTRHFQLQKHDYYVKHQLYFPNLGKITRLFPILENTNWTNAENVTVIFRNHKEVGKEINEKFFTLIQL